MNAIELKKNLHLLIYSIKNEAFLFNFYELLKRRAIILVDMVNEFISVILIFVLFTSCAHKEAVIQNQERTSDIQRMLAVQKELTSKSLQPVWTIFDQPLSDSERQAMEFLYAYMPLSDLADYKPEFFLKNVQMSLLARQDMPWGKTIPEEEFLHFVLPLRVNNENMDSFREVMYPEIKERIKGLSMKDAALEINHWCHEKVSYRGTGMVQRTCTPHNARAYPCLWTLPWPGRCCNGGRPFFGAQPYFELCNG